ncbi:hypothetical protein PsorP6_014940 [Peronosclerospora sorghi]|uniref:Uncharacterized protein n=1 Tax=Peronosclerospora sorghi TaxID=230839 RepID=A0ACC0VRP2_9STRA|nr:hypothetical protein PsorP6_014940 [Peronosclerospora sorghi]
MSRLAVILRFQATQAFLSSDEWEKWKLKGEAINRLTSTASKEADIALVIVDRSVANLRYFARSKRGVLYAGEIRSDNKPVVAKLAADATSVRSVTQEARWLRFETRMTIGPTVIDAGNGWFLCERNRCAKIGHFAHECMAPRPVPRSQRTEPSAARRHQQGHHTVGAKNENRQ